METRGRRKDAQQGKIERVFGISQRFIERDISGSIVVLVSNDTDNLLLGGSLNAFQGCVDRLKKSVAVGKVWINDKLLFDGFQIEQTNDGSIRMSMVRYLERINNNVLTRKRSKKRTDKATEIALNQYS